MPLPRSLREQLKRRLWQRARPKVPQNRGWKALNICNEAVPVIAWIILALQSLTAKDAKDAK
jgi:hypothetical protein